MVALYLLAGAGALAILTLLVLCVVWSVEWSAAVLAERGAEAAARRARGTLLSHAKYLRAVPGAEATAGALELIAQGLDEEALRSWFRDRLERRGQDDRRPDLGAALDAIRRLPR